MIPSDPCERCDIVEKPAVSSLPPIVKDHKERIHCPACGKPEARVVEREVIKCRSCWAVIDTHRLVKVNNLSFITAELIYDLRIVGEGFMAEKLKKVYDENIDVIRVFRRSRGKYILKYTP